MSRGSNRSLWHIRLLKLQNELHINLFRHHYGLLRVNSRIILCYILYGVRSFGELLHSLRGLAFSSPRIDVFLTADSCFSECEIIRKKREREIWSRQQGNIDSWRYPRSVKYLLSVGHQPQDINLLNDARENHDSIIDAICYVFRFHKPRMYWKKWERNLNLAKSKKRVRKMVRKAFKQLQYIRLNLGYIDVFVMIAKGVVLTEKQAQSG